jgi:hypothetical protein
VEETAPQRIAEKPIYQTVWGEKKEDWLKASVTGFIGPDTDNILVMYADGDDLWRKKQNERFVHALQSAGSANVSAVEVQDRTHRTIMSRILETDDSVGDLISDFMIKRVKATAEE